MLDQTVSVMNSLLDWLAVSEFLVDLFSSFYLAVVVMKKTFDAVDDVYVDFVVIVEVVVAAVVVVDFFVILYHDQTLLLVCIHASDTVSL